MVILGIDPGYAIVGYGVIEYKCNKARPLSYGVIKTDKDLSIPLRLMQIAKGMEEIIQKFRPDSIAIEELFFQSNQKTALLVAEARGVILLKSYESKAELFEYTPLQIKQAMTGYGRATKNQIQQMVKVMLNLSEVPKPDDASDALAVALTHSQTNRLNSMFKI